MPAAQGLLAGLIAWLVVVILFAIYDALAGRKERTSLLAVATPPVVGRALDTVLKSRTDFAGAVKRYEAALSQERSAVSAGPTGEGSAPSRQLFATELPELEAAKEAARERLLDAQRLWDAVKPGVGPKADIDLWMGFGFMRGWQIGPFGYERMFVRMDHAIDSTCWVVWEFRRPRYGFGLGYERQRLALFCVRTDEETLPALVARAFDGHEVAVRPGFVPSRVWRRFRRDDEAKSANKALLARHELGDLISGPDQSTRRIVSAAFEAELGGRLDSIRSLPPGPGILSIHAKGPSLSLGAWTGPTPVAELRTSSGHKTWQR